MYLQACHKRGITPPTPTRAAPLCSERYPHHQEIAAPHVCFTTPFSSPQSLLWSSSPVLALWLSDNHHRRAARRGPPAPCGYVTRTPLFPKQLLFARDENDTSHHVLENRDPLEHGNNREISKWGPVLPRPRKVCAECVFVPVNR